MDCLDENSLAAFLGRRSSAGDAQAIEEHIADCPRCRQLLGVVAELFPAKHDEGRPAPSLALAPTVRAEGAAQASESSVPSAVDGGWVRACFSMADASRRVGTMLAGRWTLRKVLGIGGMGAVFAADHRNGKKVAIKILKPELCGDPEVVRRFVREGYAANRVGHESAVAVLDDGATTDGVPYLVMEALAGETLAQRVERQGPLTLEEAVRHADVVLDVLASAHALGIIHRDVKPANVFIEQSGATRLLDFGIAHVHDGLHGSTGATQTGATLGTPAFMPPEQARGHFAEVDARSDVWAVGALLYATLTGKPVHGGQPRAAQLYEAMTSRATPIRRARPDLPQAAASVIDRALSFDRPRRWESARAMQTALREACATTMVEGTSRRRWTPLVAALSLGAVMVGGALLVHARTVLPAAVDPNPPPALAGALAPSEHPPADVAQPSPLLSAAIPTDSTFPRPEVRAISRPRRITASLPVGSSAALPSSVPAPEVAPPDATQDILSRHH
jgi:serine/threonine protein kinase